MAARASSNAETFAPSPDLGYGFRSIVEHATDVIIRFDRAGRHLYANPAAEQVTGLAVADLIGRTCEELPLAENPTDFDRATLDRVFETGREQEIEFEFSTTGRPRAFRARLVPEWGADGGVESVLAVAREITERKAMEEQLRESEERFRLLVEQSRQVFFYIHDQEHRFEYVSPSVESVLGYSPEELLGRPYDTLLTEDATAVLVHEQTGAALSGVVDAPPSTYHARVRHRNGDVLVLELVEWGVVRDGRVVGLQGFARNVTEQVRATGIDRFMATASEALASSLDYAETLRMVARQAVPVLADWCMVDVLEDDTVRRIAARHADPSKQDLADALLEFPPDMGRQQGVPHVLRTGQPVCLANVDSRSVEDAAQGERHRRILAELGVESAMIVPLRCRGRTLGALTFVVSGSGRRYTEADLRIAAELARRAAVAMDNAELHRQAHEAVSARDEVLSFVSHDLRDPLNIIVNAADLLSHRPTDTSVVEKYSGMILRAAEEMRVLIGDLLTASRMDAGRFWVDPVACDGTGLVQEVVELFEPIAEAEGVTVKADVPRSLPRIRADARRLRQAIQNLLSNAIKFTPEGGAVLLGADLREGEVRFSVSDTGPGIPERDLAHLFDRFWRGNRTKRSGAGLGLAIAKGIIEAHGGRVSAESTEGHGTTFSFTVPVD
jgi:PAS domain S-box-containing protein